MDTKEYSEAITEVLDIIKHLDEDQIEQIPLDFIKNLKERQSTTYVPNIDYTKPLQENKLKCKTKVILAIIYRDYLCNEEEQKEFDNQLKIKEEKTNNDIFSNRVEHTEDKLKLVPYEKKKSLFRKILDSILKK